MVKKANLQLTLKAQLENFCDLSVLASTSSTTFIAALSSNLSSRSPSSTISARSSLPTYRDKEIDFKIAEKYYC